MKNGFKRFVGFILIACCFFSCQQQKQSEEKQASVLGTILSDKENGLQLNDYMRWIENKENGLKVEKKIGDVTFSALYKPYEYMAITELKNEALTEKKVKEKIKEYEGLQYFTFKIKVNEAQEELLKIGVNSEQEYYARLEYFSFKMQKDFKLIDGTDTLDCVLYHFERVYGLAPFATMVLGFPLAKTTEQPAHKQAYKNKTIGYTDKLFGGGQVYMTMKEENLNRVPNLILN